MNIDVLYDMISVASGNNDMSKSFKESDKFYAFVEPNKFEVLGENKKKVEEPVIDFNFDKS